MRGFIEQFLFWSPRVLGILFALFLSIFAFDVFSEDYSAAEVILAFLIHLIPTYVVLIIVYVAWYREDIGAAMFFVLSVFYLVSGGDEKWVVLIPLIVITLLFLIAFLAQRERPNKIR